MRDTGYNLSTNTQSLTNLRIERNIIIRKFEKDSLFVDFMVILIVTIILVITIIGMIIILLRKVPVLAGLEEIKTEPGQGLFSKIGSGVFEGVKRISFEKYLHKILSKIRVLTLKTDNKTSNWLQKLRQKSQKRVNSFPDDYWKKVRKKK